MSTLSEQQRSLRQAARDFAMCEFAPYAAEWDAAMIFPREAIAKAGERGFCGVYSPESAGGLDLPRLDAALLFEELAAVDPSTAAYLSIHNMVTWMVTTWGNDELRDTWGAILTSGEALGSYCLTEPDTGSDAATLKARAQRTGSTYVINGTKAFISGAGKQTCLS